jgi:predicted nucleotidyltransferase
MQDVILARLRKLEYEQGVQVLYACESGSRAWGFASPDSDYDVRFVYARPVEQYLRLALPRDVIEVPMEGELDISGWDLFKACRLLRRSNPPLLEWLGSPIVYREQGPLAQTLRDQANRHASRRSCCEHYLHSARSNWHRYGLDADRATRKKLLYVLRPVVAVRWMLEQESLPPTPFPRALAAVAIPSAIREAIDALLAAKRVSRESATGPADPLLLRYVEQTLEELGPLVAKLEPCAFPADKLDQLLRAILLKEAAL